MEKRYTVHFTIKKPPVVNQFQVWDPNIFGILIAVVVSNSFSSSIIYDIWNILLKLFELSQFKLNSKNKIKLTNLRLSCCQ
jgi:hypothetical protein